jgi:hypothetical protein
MTSFSWRLLVSVCAAFLLVLTARAAEPAVIAKARAYLGAEPALASVNSVRYSGTLVTNDPAEATKQTRATVDIIFQRPEQQRVVMTSDKLVETTALDGYEGWTRVQDGTDASKWRLTLLGSEQIKRLRAQVWQNLGFFRGIEKVGGEVQDMGSVDVEGTTCQKIAFIHGPSIIFYRFFDVATGRLVHTETEAGGSIRENGEIVVNGIRFPKNIITASKNSAGAMQTVTITFDKITVNETYPANLFAVPTLSAK